MKFRDWVGMLFFLPAVALQFIAVMICGPRGREIIVNAYAEAVRKELEKP